MRGVFDHVLAAPARAVFALALTVRLLVVGWAYNTFPPTADGTFYHEHAVRLAAGRGYTWVWDGAEQAVAHYPVGYPAVLGAFYAAFGAAPGVAMVVNSGLGALGALALFLAADEVVGRRPALLAGLGFALHPGLLSYTPALMTEGVTAALLAGVLLVAAKARSAGRGGPGWLVLMGLLLGATTLIRPQTALLLPLLGACTGIGRGTLRALLSALLVSAAALLFVLPWTLRNCAELDQCALVSTNGGWNLLIGTYADARGGWLPLRIPDACAAAFGDVAQDRCFAREARRVIAADPWAWAALVPMKLGVTFDYGGAGAWYLHASNPQAFPAAAKLALGGIETLLQRVLLALAIIGAARAHLPSSRQRPLAHALGATAFLPWAWAAHLLFVLLAASAPLSLAPGRRFALRASAALVGSTAAVHAVFFGSGRYGLVCTSGLLAVAATVSAPVFTKRGKAGEL